MKGKLLYLTMLVAALVSTTGCKDSTAGLTYITYYPVIELKGETSIEHNKNTEFVDPGFTATINGEDVSDQVDISSDLDVSKTGIYTIGYTIVNADGFAASASRTIFVYDFDDPVIGDYLVDTEKSFYEYNGTQAYPQSFQVNVRCESDSTYLIDDMFANWFSIVKEKGEAAKMEGVISIADNDSISLVRSYVPQWKDGLNSLSNGKFDKENKTLEWVVDYTKSHALFHVFLTKKTENLEDPIEGIYTIDPESCYRDYNGKTYYEKSRQIKVRSNNDGTYTIDDMFGGWFVDDYGDGGKMEAVISINEDGTLKLLRSNAPKWNTNINFLTENSKYDAATHSFFWGADYTKNHAVYYITMHKNTNP